MNAPQTPHTLHFMPSAGFRARAKDVVENPFLRKSFRGAMDFLQGKRVAKLINFGSSVKFCRLAEGIADLYPRFGRTMEWDTCAPQAVLEAAGGTVRTFEGSDLRYGKPGWENPHFVCTGRLPD